jgi:hypothetical protein
MIKVEKVIIENETYKGRKMTSDQLQFLKAKIRSFNSLEQNLIDSVIDWCLALHQRSLMCSLRIEYHLGSA